MTAYLLEDLFLDHTETRGIISRMTRKVSNEPMEHIFSHVRHTMWVEVGEISEDIGSSSLEWTSSSGRQVRWMNQADMNEVGITAGVNKVLKSVQLKSTATGSRNSAGKKRKRNQ